MHLYFPSASLMMLNYFCLAVNEGGTPGGIEDPFVHILNCFFCRDRTNKCNKSFVPSCDVRAPVAPPPAADRSWPAEVGGPRGDQALTSIQHRMSLLHAGAPRAQRHPAWAAESRPSASECGFEAGGGGGQASVRPTLSSTRCLSPQSWGHRRQWLTTATGRGPGPAELMLRPRPGGTGRLTCPVEGEPGSTGSAPRRAEGGN